MELISAFIFASWLDPLFWIGYTRELKQEDLYATPTEARSQHLLEHFDKYIILACVLRDYCVSKIYKAVCVYNATCVKQILGLFVAQIFILQAFDSIYIHWSLQYLIHSL